MSNRTQCADTVPLPSEVVIPSPPLPIPPPSPISPTYVEGSLGSRAAGIRQRDALPSQIHETEIPEMWLPLRKRLCRTTPGPGCEVGESSQLGHTMELRMSRELGYGIRDTWDDLVGAIQEIAPTTLEGVNQRVIELSSTVDQEDEIIYSHLDDATRTALLIEEEARYRVPAWHVSIDACDQVHSEGISLRTTVMAQQSEITELQAATRCRRDY
ncbi:hypothetical protein Tco_1156687 [Tanacetum coccineum]